MEEGFQSLLAEGDTDAAYDTTECLSALLVSDRAAAVAQARIILSWNISDRELGERVVKWLDAFPEAGQLEQAEGGRAFERQMLERLIEEGERRARPGGQWTAKHHVRNRFERRWAILSP